MIITIDTEHPPTPVELKHLWNLLTDVEPGTINPVQTEQQALAEMAEEELSAPLPSPKKRAAKKAEPAQELTVQQQAIALATRLVDSDRSEVVRTALEAIDEKRVSTLSDEKAAAFIAAVEE